MASLVLFLAFGALISFHDILAMILRNLLANLIVRLWMWLHF